MTGKRKRILLADDDEIFRQVAGIWLRDAGFEVVEAADGAETVRLVAREPFDLLLLDIIMPELDGFEVLEQVRATGARMPAAFISSDESLRYLAGQKGAAEIMPELKRRIKDRLDAEGIVIKK